MLEKKNSLRLPKISQTMVIVLLRQANFVITLEIYSTPRLDNVDTKVGDNIH